MQEFFITGATGIIGRKVVSNLVDNGNSITILSRKKEKICRNFEKFGVKVILGDILQKEIYKRSLLDSDVVIHLAAEVHVGNLNRDIKNTLFQTNVEGTRRLFEIFRTSSCNQLVFTSTRQIYGKTIGIGDENSPHKGINQSYYVYTKHYGHNLALKFIEEEFPVTIAIPGTVYSPEISDSGLGKLFRLFYQGQKAVMATKSYNSYVDSEDAAKAIIATTLTKKSIGEEYIISNGFTTYEKLYSICEEVTGVNMKLINLPLILGRIGASLISPLLNKLGKDPLINKEIINNLKNSCKLSNQKSIDHLKVKYKPLIPSIMDSFKKQYEVLKTGIIN